MGGGCQNISKRFTLLVYVLGEPDKFMIMDDSQMSTILFTFYIDLLNRGRGEKKIRYYVHMP